MSTQAMLWWGVGAALGGAAFAGLAEWRRARRRELDDPGWMPWRGLQVATVFAAVALAILAMRS